MPRPPLDDEDDLDDDDIDLDASDDDPDLDDDDGDLDDDFEDLDDEGEGESDEPLAAESARQVGEVEATIDRVQSAKTQEMNQRGAAFRMDRDTEFYCALVFHTSEQRDAFLSHFGVAPAIEVNGLEMARRLKVVLPEAPPFNTQNRVKAKWAKLT